MCKGFITLTLFTIFKISLSNCNELLECDTGQYVTSVVQFNFTVREHDGLFGCMDGLSFEESKAYPGSPETLTYNVSPIGNNFTLLWKAADDSSIEHVTGFLVEMFVEEFDNTFDTGPSKCYLIESSLGFASNEGLLPQDAVFQLNCRVHRNLNVRTSVLSLPAPASGRSYREASIYVIYQGTSTKTTQVYSMQVTSFIADNSRRDVEANDTGTFLAISIGVVGLSFAAIITVIYLVYKHRNQTYTVTRTKDERSLNNYSAPFNRSDAFQHITTHSEGTIGFGKEIEEIKSRGNVMHTNHKGIPYPNDVSQNFEVNVKSSNSYTVVTTNQETEINIFRDSNRSAGSIPETYRMKLQAINLDS